MDHKGDTLTAQMLTLGSIVGAATHFLPTALRLGVAYRIAALAVG